MKIVSLHLHCRVINVDVIDKNGGIVAPLLLRHRGRRYIERNTLGGVVSLHLHCCVIGIVIINQPLATVTMTR